MKAKTQLSKAKSRSGFTLVEMLVVIGMIGALAGISFPVYRSIQNKVEKQQFEMGFQSIERAIGYFETEYNYLPTAGGASQWDGELLTTPAQMTTFITILAGAERDSGVANPVNFKNIAFLEPTPLDKGSAGNYQGGFVINANESVSFYTPWGEQFLQLIIDSDMNEEFRIPYVKTVEKLSGKRFIVYGWGADDTWRTDDDWGNFEFPGVPWTD